MMLEMMVGVVIFAVGLLFGAVFGQGFGEAKAYREMAQTPQTHIYSGDKLQ
jgi:hypothetical protein